MPATLPDRSTDDLRRRFVDIREREMIRILSIACQLLLTIADPQSDDLSPLAMTCAKTFLRDYLNNQESQFQARLKS